MFFDASFSWARPLDRRDDRRDSTTRHLAFSTAKQTLYVLARQQILTLYNPIYTI